MDQFAEPKNDSPASGGWKLSLALVAVGILAFGIGSNILDAYFMGEDEALFIRLIRSVVEYSMRGDWRNVGFSLLYHDHPPAPILLTAPFIYWLGYNEAALRLPNVLLWAINCMVAAKIGWRLGGLRVGLLTGIFLAVSGIFDLQGLGFGAAGETLSVLLLVNVLLDDFEWHLETPQARKKYLWGGIYLALGYLFFTSTLPVIAAYHGLFLFFTLKSNPRWSTFWQYIQISFPLIAFYLIYTAIFMGIPAYEAYRYDIRPYGQLGQNLGRAGVSKLGITSLWVNLRVMNWYVFPFLPWLILAVGMFSQLKKYPLMFLSLVGYGAIWSFYLRGNTGQHFLAYFCWLTPFGIAAVEKYLWKKSSRLSWAVWTILLGSLLIWTYQTHLKTYSYETYPRGLAAKTWSEPLGWVNNIYRPLRKIAMTLDQTLKPNEKYISLIDGALSLYYYPNEEQAVSGVTPSSSNETSQVQCLWLPQETIKTYRIRAIVSYTDQTVCPELIEKEIRYPGSNLLVTLLAPQP